MRNKGLLVNKKLKDPDYVESRYRLLCAEEKKWSHFRNFECSEFFNGKHLAKLNLKKILRSHETCLATNENS